MSCGCKSKNIKKQPLNKSKKKIVDLDKATKQTVTQSKPTDFKETDVDLFIP